MRAADDQLLPLWEPATPTQSDRPTPPAAVAAPRRSRAAQPMTIAQLTRRIRLLLEGSLANVWVEGEISNFKVYHPSGHAYFTLKDADCQIAAVMFHSALRRVKFTPDNGMKVLITGDVRVYEKQGKYQIVCETLEPSGIGALQLAFEQLKAKLAAEGLFDAARKRPLPLLPRTIGVVTSRSGAAVRDILNVLLRRFPSIHVVVVPVAVQGDGAAAEIAGAIEECNRLNTQHDRNPGAQPLHFDVLIVGRGGGSIEDLWAFNEEIVARAIAASAIPIISAVGHETDWTIADFVADVRAPTPSAAAEMVIQPLDAFRELLASAHRRIRTAMTHQLEQRTHALRRLQTHYAFREAPRVIDGYRQQVDDARAALRSTLDAVVADRRERVARASQIVRSARRLFEQRCARDSRVVSLRRAAIERACAHSLARMRDSLARYLACLEALGPAAVVRRGYTITRHAASGRILMDAAQAVCGEVLTTSFRDGSVDATVQQVRLHTPAPNDPDAAPR
jgi:exodeoxyribonuclease VII large subunit